MNALGLFLALQKRERKKELEILDCNLKDWRKFTSEVQRGEGLALCCESTLEHGVSKVLKSMTVHTLTPRDTGTEEGAKENPARARVVVCAFLRS